MSRRRVGIKDVAAEAGVSVTTVSHVLNDVDFLRASEETRQPAVDGLGLHPRTMPSDHCRPVIADQPSPVGRCRPVAASRRDPSVHRPEHVAARPPVRASPVPLFTSVSP